MKKILILTFTVLLILTATTLKAQSYISKFVIPDLYLTGGVNLNIVSGQPTNFNADFTVLGGAYSDLIVLYLGYRETNGVITIISDQLNHYIDPNGPIPDGVWSGIISGTLPAGKTTGRIVLCTYWIAANNNQSAEHLSTNSYGIAVGGINPYPGSIIIDAYTKINGEAQTLRPEGFIVGGTSWAYAGHAFRAYSTQVQGTVPIFEFYGEYSLNNTTTLFTPYANQPSFWWYQQVAFYAFISQVPGSVPVYLYTNAAGRNHFFTIHQQTDPYWHLNSTAFWAYPVN